MKTYGFQTFPFLIGIPVAETTGNCKFKTRFRPYRADRNSKDTSARSNVFTEKQSDTTDFACLGLILRPRIFEGNKTI